MDQWPWKAPIREEGSQVCPCCQIELQERGEPSKPQRAARAALPVWGSQGGIPVPKNPLLNCPARQELCANVGTATQPQTGHRTAHSLPRVLPSFPPLKIRDLFPDAAGLLPQNVWEWPGCGRSASLGRKTGTRDRKGLGFRVVVMDTGLGLWPGCLGPATQLCQWPHRLCLSHGKGRRAYHKCMAVLFIPWNNSQIF